MAETLSAMIERCTSIDHAGWLDLRQALWPHCSRAEHLSEMSSFIVNPGRHVQLVAYSSPGHTVGLAEASVRTDYVNGARGLFSQSAVGGTMKVR